MPMDHLGLAIDTDEIEGAIRRETRRIENEKKIDPASARDLVIETIESVGIRQFLLMQNVH